MNFIEIQTAETIKNLDKKAKVYKARAQERDEWKKKHDEFLKTVKEEEIKLLKNFDTAKVGHKPPKILATMNSDGSRDTQSRTKAQELCIPREPCHLYRHLSLQRDPETP